jgi:hypothetical protein
MSGPLVPGPTGGPYLPFCERCGNLIGPAAHLLRIGLSMCPSCGVYACDRCWTRAGGGCPGCGISAGVARYLAAAAAMDTAPAVGAALPVSAAAAVGAAVPVSAESALDVAGASGGASHGLPRAWRAPIVFAGVGAMVLAASALAFTILGPARPVGELELALGTPAAVATGTGQSPESSLSAGAAGPTSSGVALSPAPSVAPQIPSATPTLPSVTDEPPPAPGQTPAATPEPTPRPTPAPTPRPTPAPTPKPTPRPTPCLLPAPQLVGEHRYDAAGIWSGAGFTGAVIALHGDGNYLIASQDLLAGQMYPCDASVTVGPPAPAPT